MVELNWTMLWQVINFLVLMGVLIKFLYNPVMEMLDKRADTIKSELKQAEEQKQEAEELKKEYEQKLKEARDKAQQIVNDAEKRGKKKSRDIIAEAEEESEIIKQNKMKEIERAKKEAVDELKNEVADISIMAAGRIIEENLDKSKHEDLINQYIEQLDREKIGEIQ
ncbi:MAG: F0F1 ATP synthase subunit B [Halanaerobiaceae bacterium]